MTPQDLNNQPLEPAIEDYINFLSSANTKNVKVLRKERVKNKLELYTEALNTFLVYPDIFSDITTPHNSHFSLFFAQRIVLRCFARHRQTFATFTRAFSKSFLADYFSYLRAMMIPHCNGFVAAATGKQAAEIVKQKFSEDLWVKFPILKNEMVKRNGRTPYIQGEDYAEFRFTNGSRFDVIGGHPRGGRRNYGVFEEIIEQDQTKVNEELIPLLNSPRTMANGQINPYEKQGQKMYITTAGYQGTFSYDKCLETLCYCAIDPNNYMVLGGSYIIPVMHGRLEEQTMRELLSSPSFDRGSLEREYISRWSGAKSGSVFSIETIDTLRKIQRAEYKPIDLTNSQDFYVMSADIAKDGSADTAIIISRVSPKDYMFNFKFINLFTINSTDFEVVANELKKQILLYDIKLFVYDANGVGASLRDWLNKPTQDRSGLPLPGFGIINPPDSSKRDIIKYTRDREICYEIKSGGKIGEQIHKMFFARVSNGSIRIPVKAAEAVAKLQHNKSFLEASDIKRRKILQAYRYADLMEQELRNLIVTDTSDNINSTMKVERRDQKIQKDFFSAAEYLIYGVNQQIEQPYYKRNAKKKNTLTKAFFIS